MNEWKEVHDRKDRKALVGWKMNGRGLQSLGIASGSQGRYIFGKGPSRRKKGECRLAAPVAVRGLLPYPVKRACPFYGDMLPWR